MFQHAPVNGESMVAPDEPEAYACPVVGRYRVLVR